MADNYYDPGMSGVVRLALSDCVYVGLVEWARVQPHAYWVNCVNGKSVMLYRDNGFTDVLVASLYLYDGYVNLAVHMPGTKVARHIYEYHDAPVDQLVGMMAEGSL